MEANYKRARGRVRSSLSKGKNARKKLNRIKVIEEINLLYAVTDGKRMSLYGTGVVKSKPLKAKSQLRKAYKDQERFLDKDG